MKFKSAFAVFCAALALAVFCVRSPAVQAQSKANKTASKSTLSPAEQDVLSEINKLRARPAAYISYLEGLKPFFKGKEYNPTGQPALTTQEAWEAVDDAIRFLRSAKAQGPLSVSPGLCLAAAMHVKDQSGTGATGHKGVDSTFIEQRVKPFGTWDGGIAENLSYGTESARERVLTWLIDDGFAGRGHRKRLLSGDYRVAGLSCGPHPEFNTMCALALAGGFKDAATGKTLTSAPAKVKTPAKSSGTTNSNKGKTTTKPRSE